MTIAGFPVPVGYCRPRPKIARRSATAAVAAVAPGIVLLAAALLVVLPRAGAGQDVDSCFPFVAPRRVSDGSGQATQTATGLDVANNAYIAMVIDERIKVKIIGPALDIDVPLAADGLGQGDPDFATTSSGITYMSFIQLNENTPGEGSEIYLTDNQGGGGGFHAPTNVSNNRADDYAPRLVLDQKNHPHLAWAQRVGDLESRVLYLNTGLGNAGPGGGTPIPAAVGDYPHLFVDDKGVVHLVYSRKKDLFYNNNLGGTFNNEIAITTTAEEPESSASIGVDPAGTVLVAFQSRHSLYYATKPPEAGFRPAQLVDAGGILNPRMRVRSRGQVTIVYAKEGDIHYVIGQSTFLVPPQRICEPTEQVESLPSLEVDLEGNIHLSYIRGGDVFYTNTAKQPVADFSAIPTVGEVPLTVHFGDLSSGGGIQVWDWDFGDGATSKEQNPVHTYTKPEKYKVTLTVSGPGGVSSTKERPDFIFVQDPFFTMRIPDQRVFPGQTDVWFPVITARKERSQGFQIMTTYDPNFLTLKSVEFSNTVLESRAAPEFYQANNMGTYVDIGCIYEWVEPIDVNNIYLPPGENQVLQQFVFDVSEAAPQGAKTRIELVNNYAISRIFNIFIVDGFARLPALKGSTVEVIVVQPPFPRSFLRGDVDLNGKIELTDAVRILGYLFTGGQPPACFDAADVNDIGRVDISSAVSLLNFLFTGGGQPAVPYPNKGLDPTSDGLTDC